MSARRRRTLRHRSDLLLLLAAAGLVYAYRADRRSGAVVDAVKKAKKVGGGIAAELASSLRELAQEAAYEVLARRLLPGR